jgi:NADH-quinone oxidoreductase subunit N
MWLLEQADAVAALPEIVLAVLTLALLMLGVFRKSDASDVVTLGALVALAITALLVIFAPDHQALAFHGALMVDTFARVMKVLALFGSAAALVLSVSFMKRDGTQRFEYPVLILLATIGMMLMISANNLIALYMGLELQSLSLYVLAAINRDSARASEAGLKYFVLGALSSGMLLYGASLVYGFTGSTEFPEIAAHLTKSSATIGMVFGLVFVIAGLAFKISAVPFHMWTPDVYEGAPTPVTAFFAAAPKVAAMALFTRTMMDAFGAIQPAWGQIIVVIAIASMALGAFAAIGQSNIKRLLAYSSIANMGYALVGLAAGTQEGVQGVVVYMIIYMIMTLGAFACILAMRRKGHMVEEISDLAGLSRNHKGLAFVFSMLMFSMAGIPPLAGFFGKYFVFLAAVKAGLYALAIIGVITSVVGAYYYLRVVKIMYFDEPKEAFEPMDGEVKLIAYASGAFTLLFVLPWIASTVIAVAAAAAKSFY